MDDIIPQHPSNSPTSPPATFVADHNLRVEDGAGKNPVSKTVKLDLEMEKRNVTENTIACEILEAEVRMEVMMEKQKMGSSDDDLGQKMKMISHPVDQVDDLDQINQDPQKNNVFEKVLGQGVPSSGISGMKRKAETSAEEEKGLVSKDLQNKKWHCSLCEVSTTSAGGYNLHIHGKKHRAKEAMFKPGETVNKISINNYSPDKSLLSTEEKKSQVQPAEEEKSQVEPAEEEKSQVQPIEEEESQVQPMEEEKCQVQPTEEQKSQVQPAEEEKIRVQPSEEEKILVQPSEEEKSQVQPIEEEESQVQPMEEEKCQVQPTEEQKSQVQPAEEEKILVQPSEEEKSQVQPIEEEESQVQPMEEEKCQVQPTEEQKSQVQPAEEEKILVQPSEEEKSQVQPIEEEESQVQPMEEKESQVQPVNEDKSLIQPMEDDKTVELEKSPVTKKWECSLCQVSVTSETLLISHLQGKKHKAKAAKLGIVLVNNETEVESEDTKKWYCSVCQVSASSENNLNDHLQGKKHKAKAGLLHQEADNVDSNSGENAKAMEERCLEGDEGFRNEQEVVNKLNIAEAGIKGVITNCEENKKETINTESIETDKLGNGGEETGKELVKFWLCKTCNEGTYDEAAMDTHRKSTKHMDLLRKIGGGVIVVSNVLKEAAVCQKGF
ncbi:unnamed protein product [Amaranthus hypochondriacus]